MAVKIWRTGSINAFQTTLNGGISAGDVSITLTTATGLVAPGILVLDRQDNNGTNTPTNREFISYTGISTNTLTGCTRGVAGSTAQSHSSGALVEETFTTTHWGDLADYLAVSHDAAGLIVTSAATIGTLRLTSFLNASGASIVGDFPLNPVWSFQALASTATTSVGKPLYTPSTGAWKWFAATLINPASGATMIIDINNNGTSIFDAGTRLMIPAGGTYASTASIATKVFVSGNRFTSDLDQIGATSSDVMVQGRS